MAVLVSEALERESNNLAHSPEHRALLDQASFLLVRAEVRIRDLMMNIVSSHELDELHNSRIRLRERDEQIARMSKALHRFEKANATRAKLRKEKRSGRPANILRGRPDGWVVQLRTIYTDRGQPDYCTWSRLLHLGEPETGFATRDEALVAAGRGYRKRGRRVVPHWIGLS